MDNIRFIFWEAMKTLSLAFLGLLAVKAVGSLRAHTLEAKGRRLAWVKGVLYCAVLALAILGARSIGYDVAAELYHWASQDNLDHARLAKAYSNAMQAVQLRPGRLRYWRQLAVTKLALRQYASVLQDLPVFESLSGGQLDEADAYRFAVCYFFLAQYDTLIPSTQQLIRQNRMFAAPYVLQGMAYTAQKNYLEAERSFLAALQIFPSHRAAVEGLAHAYFLAGNRASALSVLNETARYPFPSEARRRFELLKALYAQ